MKQVKKFIYIVIILIYISSLFGGCQNKELEFYSEMSLENAYNLGCLKQEDLRSIAYYYNENTETPTFELIPKVELDKKIENNIKLSYLQKTYIKEVYPNATINDIQNFEYYGTYNGYAVVFIIDSLFGYDFVFEPEYMIGGVPFYNYCQLSVYKINI